MHYACTRYIVTPLATLLDLFLLPYDRGTAVAFIWTTIGSLECHPLLFYNIVGTIPKVGKGSASIVARKTVYLGDLP